ncbi:MAG TPA: D-alanyl-D-alanine carboxypeptidase family protein [Myxococcota bacterium]
MRVNNVPTLVAAFIIALGMVPGCANELEIDQFDHEEPFDDGSNIELQGVYDCTERSDNGYTSGTRTAIKVVKVDDRPVEVNTANAYIALQEAAKRDGVNIRIVSGFRTQSEQQYFYNCYVNCNCNSCNLAARPGYSNHQSGHALDLNYRDAGVLTWLNNNGARFGWRRTVPSEAWHWEWWGSASTYPGPCGANSIATSVAPDDCGTVSNGGVIEEDDACMTLGGPEQYLRSVSDSNASDGSLVWTGATANSSAGNYGIWWVKAPAAGRYKLEVFINRDYSTSQQAKYSVRHNGATDVVTLNTTTAGGWRSLGEFQFSATPGERVRLDDNTGERSSLSRKLAFDGLRVTRVDASSTPPPPPSTTSCTEVRVTTTALNVRPTASTAQAARGTLQEGQIVDRLSSVSGQEVSGNTTWYQIRTGSLTGYISAVYATCVN